MPEPVPEAAVREAARGDSPREAPAKAASPAREGKPTKRQLPPYLRVVK
jgi:hypothetical protein